MARFESVCSRRFWTAPNCARWAETESIAASISEMSVELPALSATTAAFTTEPSDTVATVMISPSCAPTWNEIVLAALSSLMPLNSAVDPIRSISDPSMLTSDWIASLSHPDIVAPGLNRKLAPRRQRAVLVLNGQLANALEHRVDLGERALRRLDERD